MQTALRNDHPTVRWMFVMGAAYIKLFCLVLPFPMQRITFVYPHPFVSQAKALGEKPCRTKRAKQEVVVAITEHSLSKFSAGCLAYAFSENNQGSEVLGQVALTFTSEIALHCLASVRLRLVRPSVILLLLTRKENMLL